MGGLSVSTFGIVAPLRGGIPGEHWTNVESLRSLSSRPSRASSHRDGGGGRSILRASGTLGQTISGLWLCCFSFLHRCTLSRASNGEFSSICRWARCGGRWSSVRTGPQRFQARVLRRTLLWDIFVCILWLHAVWHFAATVFALRKAVTAAAGSVAARVGGNDVLGPIAAAQVRADVLPMACGLDRQDPVPLPPRLRSRRQLHRPRRIIALQLQLGLCAASGTACRRSDPPL